MIAPEDDVEPPILASNHCTLYIKGNFICLIAVRYDPIIEATQAGTNTGVKARKSMHRLGLENDCLNGNADLQGS